MSYTEEDEEYERRLEYLGTCAHCGEEVKKENLFWGVCENCIHHMSKEELRHQEQEHPDEESKPEEWFQEGD